MGRASKATQEGRKVGTMATRVLLLVGTRKGVFIAEADAARRRRSLRGSLREGWPIHHMSVDPASGAIFAAAGSPWYGPAVWRSDDLGATWSHSSAGLLIPAVSGG